MKTYFQIFKLTKSINFVRSHDSNGFFHSLFSQPIYDTLLYRLTLYCVYYFCCFTLIEHTIRQLSKIQRVHTDIGGDRSHISQRLCE